MKRLLPKFGGHRRRCCTNCAEALKCQLPLCTKKLFCLSILFFSYLLLSRDGIDRVHALGQVAAVLHVAAAVVEVVVGAAAVAAAAVVTIVVVAAAAVAELESFAG